MNIGQKKLVSELLDTMELFYWLTLVSLNFPTGMVTGDADTGSTQMNLSYPIASLPKGLQMTRSAYPLPSTVVTVPLPESVMVMGPVTPLKTVSMGAVMVSSSLLHIVTEWVR